MAAEMGCSYSTARVALKGMFDRGEVRRIVTRRQQSNGNYRDEWIYVRKVSHMPARGPR